MAKNESSPAGSEPIGAGHWPIRDGCVWVDHEVGPGHWDHGYTCGHRRAPETASSPAGEWVTVRRPGTCLLELSQDGGNVYVHCGHGWSWPEGSPFAAESWLGAESWRACEQCVTAQCLHDKAPTASSPVRSISEDEWQRRVVGDNVLPMPDWFRKSMECWCDGGIGSTPHPIGVPGCIIHSETVAAPFSAGPHGTWICNFHHIPLRECIDLGRLACTGMPQPDPEPPAEIAVPCSKCGKYHDPSKFCDPREGRPGEEVGAGGMDGGYWPTPNRHEMIVIDEPGEVGPDLFDRILEQNRKEWAGALAEAFDGDDSLDTYEEKRSGVVRAANAFVSALVGLSVAPDVAAVISPLLDAVAELRAQAVIEIEQA